MSETGDDHMAHDADELVAAVETAEKCAAIATSLGVDALRVSAVGSEVVGEPAAERLSFLKVVREGYVEIRTSLQQQSFKPGHPSVLAFVRAITDNDGAISNAFQPLAGPTPAWLVKLKKFCSSMAAGAAESMLANALEQTRILPVLGVVLDQQAVGADGNANGITADVWARFGQLCSSLGADGALQVGHNLAHTIFKEYAAILPQDPTKRRPVVALRLRAQQAAVDVPLGLACSSFTLAELAHAASIVMHSVSKDFVDALKGASDLLCLAAESVIRGWALVGVTARRS